MAKAGTIGRTEFFFREERARKKFSDFLDSLAFVEKMRPYPDVLDFGLLEEVVDMPEVLLLFS